MVSIEELKDYARVDGNEDDALIASLGTAAQEFVEQATGKTFPDPMPERAKLAIKALVTFWYENRGDADVLPPSHVRRLINQLRDWRERCSEEDAA